MVLLTALTVVEFRIEQLPVPDGQYQLEVQVERMGLIRNTLAAARWGAAQVEAGVLQHVQELMGSAETGIHFLRVRLRAISGEEEEEAPVLAGAEAVFRVSSHLLIGPVTQAEVVRAERARNNAIQAELATPVSGGRGNLFSVYVFCAATLIHGEHHFAGFTIYPLQNALTEEALRNAMNAFTMQQIGIEVMPDAGLSANFKQSSPAYVIAYHRVRATSHDDALIFAQQHADHVNDVLGVERGQKASVFGVLSMRLGRDDDIRVGYYYPGYRGNKIPPMFSGDIENYIERTLPRLQNSAWARLLFSNFADATSEFDPGIQHLRYWSLMELIAKKHIISETTQIFYPDGSPILSAKGKPVLTRGAQAKVYAHLISLGTFQSSEGDQNGTVHFEGAQPVNAPPGEEVIRLWEDLGAMYAIRNSVAHTGEYTPDATAAPNSDSGRAARFYQSGSLMQRFRDRVRIALSHELAAIT